MKQYSYLCKLWKSAARLWRNNRDKIEGNSYRTTPNIKLLDSRRARGSFGSEIKSQSWVMSAVRTERFGSFLKLDLEPSVAASLKKKGRQTKVELRHMNIRHHRRPKPLSRFPSNSAVKNMVVCWTKRRKRRGNSSTRPYISQSTRGNRTPKEILGKTTTPVVVEEKLSKNKHTRPSSTFYHRYQRDEQIAHPETQST